MCLALRDKCVITNSLLEEVDESDDEMTPHRLRGNRCILSDLHRLRWSRSGSNISFDHFQRTDRRPLLHAG